jgi:hypothetical protein
MVRLPQLTAWYGEEHITKTGKGQSRAPGYRAGTQGACTIREKDLCKSNVQSSDFYHFPMKKDVTIFRGIW